MITEVATHRRLQLRCRRDIAAEREHMQECTNNYISRRWWFILVEPFLKMVY